MQLHHEPYQPHTFDLPDIAGITAAQIDLHLGLYNGYVKNLNALYELLGVLHQDQEKHGKTVAELTRRINFELAGVQNHDVYFGSLVGEPKPCAPGTFLTLIEKQHGSFDAYKEYLLRLADSVRGIGWVMTVFARERNALHTIWVSDHELGGVGLPVLVALDMWEHAYLTNYAPSQKREYAQAYLNAMNWETVAAHCDKV